MRIGFEVESFKKRPRGLIEVLYNLRAAGQFPLQHHSEVEEIVCRVPSLALKYCQVVVGAFGVSSKAERVFLKNPGIGIRYLRIVMRDRFGDEDTQRRFWRKVVRDPSLALEWSREFRRRLSPEEEMVFVENADLARQYAYSVIRGPFPEEVHNKLLLKSFGGLEEWESRALKEYLKWAEPQMKNLEVTRG